MNRIILIGNLSGFIVDDCLDDVIDDPIIDIFGVRDQLIFQDIFNRRTHIAHAEMPDDSTHGLHAYSMPENAYPISYDRKKTRVIFEIMRISKFLGFIEIIHHDKVAA